VAVAYIGLRKTINDGNIRWNFNQKQPTKKAYTTVLTHINKILEWKANPDLFLDELKESKEDDLMLRAIKEELK